MCERLHLVYNLENRIEEKQRDFMLWLGGVERGKFFFSINYGKLQGGRKKTGEADIVGC